MELERVMAWRVLLWYIAELEVRIGVYDGVCWGVRRLGRVDWKLGRAYRDLACAFFATLS